jgi:activator of HSP90 ATPase
MIIRLFTRRDFSARLAACIPALVLARTAAASPATAAGPASDQEISHTAEAIHQEVAFKASPKRVFEAIMDDKQFSKRSGDLPAQISREAGGAFSCFGGQIKGRNIELVPNQRIVQAWRSEGWNAGIYSIARFELTEDRSGTKLIFDHTGFPVGQAEHLLAGWKSHYWDSIEKYLA